MFGFTKTILGFPWVVKVRFSSMRHRPKCSFDGSGTSLRWLQGCATSSRTQIRSSWRHWRQLIGKGWHTAIKSHFKAPASSCHHYQAMTLESGQLPYLDQIRKPGGAQVISSKFHGPDADIVVWNLGSAVNGLGLLLAPKLSPLHLFQIFSKVHHT